jgi:hypothetical protein
MKNPFLIQLLVPLLALSCYASEADNAFKVDTNTVALWNFGEGSAEGTGDEASSGIEFRPYPGENAVPLEEVDGKFGKALFFPGNAALIGTEGPVVETPEEVTLEIWMKLASEGENSSRGVFQYAAHSTSGFRMAIGISGHLSWMIQDGTKEVGVDTRAPLPVDEWMHIAGTYDGFTMKIYINGVLDAEMLIEGGNPQGLGPPIVGMISAEGPPYFRGAIEAIRISNVALTTFDIP